MKLALAQINPTVGDFAGNGQKIKERVTSALREGADLIVFSEQAVGGYPPRDLAEREFFIRDNVSAVQSLAALSKDACIVMGLVLPNPEKAGHKVLNAAAILKDGKIAATYAKRQLPTYDVFDELRYFSPGKVPLVFEHKGKTIGLSICEDVWNPKEFWERPKYEHDPIEDLANLQPDLILNISASPFSLGHDAIREELVRTHAKKYGIPFALCNQVGANDDIIFDGQSFVVNQQGTLLAKGKAFEEDLILANPFEERKGREEWTNLSNLEKLRRALLLGIRDYIQKCGFSRVVIGLSGGVDSSVAVCLLAEALGPEAILGVMMPSRFSSRESLTDALDVAKKLRIATETISIESVFKAYLKEFDALFGKRDFSVVEENAQARIRGNLMMAISNREKALVISTGNKSEIAVGYCTLYGDLSGGLAVISDVPKTLVYELARYYRDAKGWISDAIINKPPSAELRLNQCDQDTLPPYEILDKILVAYVEEGKEIEDLISMGFEAKVVHWIVEAVDRNEYKRRQTPVGLRVTSKAFGSGRRMPIAWSYQQRIR